MMKLFNANSIQRILLALILGGALVSAHGQSQLKIGTIDFKTVFDGYWKKKQAEKNLQERQESFQEARKGLVEEYRTANEDYRKLVESASDQAVSAEERERRKRQSEVKLQDIKEIEGSIEQFDRQAQATLSEQRQRSMNNIIREIREVIDSKAKAEKYSMILDSSGQTPNYVPLVIYHDGTRDISDSILTTLNVNAPAPFKQGK